MRKTTALIAALGILAALTACSNDSASAGCGTSVVSDDASSVVTATGKFASTPKVTFPTPVVSSKTQKTQLIAGTGAPLQSGQSVDLEVSLYNGANGKLLGQTSYNGSDAVFETLDKKTAVTVPTAALQCSTVGSRVVIVSPAKESHGGQADPTNDIAAGDSFVYVVDITKAYPSKASGVSQVPQPGLPAVVLAPNGAPGITVPKEKAPKKLKIEVLQAGSGKKIKDGDTAIIKYTGLNWDDSTVFDSSWLNTGQATPIPVKTGSVIPGFVKGLTGQRVGSQVLLVVPPSDGYGAQGSGSVPANATLVFVVDILGITK